MSFILARSARIVSSQALGATKKGMLQPNWMGSNAFSLTRSAKNSNTVQQQLEHIVKTKAQRPRSPFYIYQPQLTSILSIFHRVSGAGIGLGFYGVALAFPVFGLKSEKVVEYLKTVPAEIKYATKFIIAFPFMFHNFNGIRHLVWDTASALTMKGVYSSGYLVLGSSVVSSIALASV